MLSLNLQTTFLAEMLLSLFLYAFTYIIKIYTVQQRVHRKNVAQQSYANTMISLYGRYGNSLRSMILQIYLRCP